MSSFLILFAVVLTIALSLLLRRRSAMTPRLRRLFATMAVAGVLVFGGVLWWTLSA